MLTPHPVRRFSTLIGILRSGQRQQNDGKVTGRYCSHDCKLNDPLPIGLSRSVESGSCRRINSPVSAGGLPHSGQDAPITSGWSTPLRLNLVASPAARLLI
jgi:hypothetical protein